MAMCCGILVNGSTAETRGGVGAEQLSVRAAGDFIGEDSLFTHAPRRSDIVGVVRVLSWLAPYIHPYPISTACF